MIILVLFPINVSWFSFVLHMFSTVCELKRGPYQFEYVFYVSVGTLEYDNCSIVDLFVPPSFS